MFDAKSREDAGHGLRDVILLDVSKMLRTWQSTNSLRPPSTANA